MRELALHLLDIAENSIAARAKTIRITVEEDTLSDRLIMVVEDDGIGMDAQTVARVIDPFVTSRTTRKVGLGIPLLKAAAEACNGHLKITSALGEGTRLEVAFQHSHIDRMPLGDLTGTLLSLIIGAPQIHWRFGYRMNDVEFAFDDEVLKQELGELSLSEPVVLSYIRQSLEEGISGVRECSGARSQLASYLPAR